MSRKVLVERVTARVFCHPSAANSANGGNPVTVFLPHRPLMEKTYESLAKNCEWESVMVESSNNNHHQMAFYMPSGLQVSFCAHAALGGAVAAASSSITSTTTTEVQAFPFTPKMLPDETHRVDILPSQSEACLTMENATLEDSPVSHAPSLQRLLRNHLGVSGSMLGKNHRALPPTFRNSSVIRSKTLVHLNDVEDLRDKIRIPRGLSTSTGRNTFADACGAIDESTGIYLYSHLQDDSSTSSWEARQFPRASGYPEDPATGIAAAALAASMTKHYSGGGLPPTNYNIYQGMSMDRPSLIQVVNLKFENDEKTLVTLGLKGKVEIDDKETIEIDEGE
jgi:PhzF family phenazine biosynthesis protein